MTHDYKPETLFNHLSSIPLADDNVPLTPPIYQSVKFTFSEFTELKKTFERQRPGYFYSRHENPTTDLLASSLATVRGYDGGIVLASGMAAVATALMSTLKAGDQLVYFVQSYRPTRIFAESVLKRFGVQTVRLSIDDHPRIKAEFSKEQTKAVIFESITNPQLMAADWEFITHQAQQHEVTTILDHTFAGLNSSPVKADLEVHSLTKYAAGHGDVMGGAILTSKKFLPQIQEALHLFGPTLDPHAAFLIQRGLKTYHVRRQAEVKTAFEIASWLEKHPKIGQVNYPGLISHPQHEFFKKNFTDFGTMIFFNLKNTQFPATSLVDKGKLFKLAASLGSTESLIVPALYFYGGDLSESERHKAGITPSSIRLSIGLEAKDDLIADLENILINAT